MLLNEFLKEHRRTEAEHKKKEHLGETVAEQQNQIEALTVAVQKVIAEVRLSQAAHDCVAADN